MSDENKKQMISEKSWEEFQKTGLLLFINQILHVFGWTIVIEIEGEDNLKVIRGYPARTNFRGFHDKNVEESYIKISEYMKNNADELLKEAKDE